MNLAPLTVPWVPQVAGQHCIDKLRSRRLEKHSCVAGIDVSSVIDDSAPSALSQILREEELRQFKRTFGSLAGTLPGSVAVALLQAYDLFGDRQQTKQAASRSEDADLPRKMSVAP